jgi:hypothetical protein
VTVTTEPTAEVCTCCQTLELVDGLCPHCDQVCPGRISTGRACDACRPPGRVES